MNIEQLITSLEGKTLEFKRYLSSPRPMLKTLLTFANTAGGRLIVGVADDRQVIGVEHPLNEEAKWGRTTVNARQLRMKLGGQIYI
jgi:ATP-dependent DNA helicase RecG